MKKHICLILVLALALSLPALSGCDKNDDKGSVSPLVLRDFERYNPDFMALQMSQNFGEIDVNTDEAYVTSGKQSAKLRLGGGYYYSDPPTLGIPFYSTLAGYNHKDLSKFESVGMSLYNAETYDITLYWNFMFFDGQSSQRQKITLKPGWNQAVMKTDLDKLNMFYHLKDCSGVKLGFDDFSLTGLDFEEAPTLYLDDVTLYPAAYEYLAPEVDIVLDPYEICSFEKAYQAYILKPSSATDALPETEVTEETEGIKPTQGNKMLKVSFPKGRGGYARIAFSPKLFLKIGFARFKDTAADYSIAYDVYNATGTPRSIATYYIWGGIKEWPNPQLAWNVNMQAGNTALPWGEWTTYRMPLSTVYGWDKRTLEEEFHMFMLFGDDVPKGTSYYFDNFRIEKNR